jgi:hypothetical protein
MPLNSGVRAPKMYIEAILPIVFIIVLGVAALIAARRSRERYNSKKQIEELNRRLVARGKKPVKNKMKKTEGTKYDLNGIQIFYGITAAILFCGSVLSYQYFSNLYGHIFLSLLIFLRITALIYDHFHKKKSY